MPAKKLIPRDAILACAMELLESDGSEALNDTPADRAFIDATVSGIMRAGGYSRAVAERFYYATWFFMYGIAVQMVYGFASPKWDDIRGLLLDQFGALKLYYSQYREEAQHE